MKCCHLFFTNLIKYRVHIKTSAASTSWKRPCECRFHQSFDKLLKSSRNRWNPYLSAVKLPTRYISRLSSIPADKGLLVVCNTGVVQCYWKYECLVCSVYHDSLVATHFICLYLFLFHSMQLIWVVREEMNKVSYLLTFIIISFLQLFLSFLHKNKITNLVNLQYIYFHLSLIIVDFFINLLSLNVI